MANYRCLLDKHDYPYRRWPGEPDWVDPTRPNHTKEQAPYSYSEFFRWRSWRADRKPKDAVADYSDRLFQWDYAKARASAGEVGGRMDQWGREECSRFLTLYYGRPITALALAEGCNPSNGYPYFIFWYMDATPEATP